MALSTSSDANLPSIIDLIGNTPLIALDRSLPNTTQSPIYIKHEGYNPGGSVRDRTALEVLDCAAGSGLLRVGDEIVLAAATNSALSATMIAHARGYRPVVFHPKHANDRLLGLIKEAGARIVASPEGEGFEGAIRAAARYARDGIDRVFIDAGRREATVDAIHAIAREIVEALGDDPLGAFVTSVSTGSTLRYVAQALRQHNPHVHVAGVIIRSPPERKSLYDDVAPSARSSLEDLEDVGGTIIHVTEAEAWRMRAHVARREGILLGPKGASAVLGALKIQHKTPNDHATVALSIDGGQRYLHAVPDAIQALLDPPSDHTHGASP